MTYYICMDIFNTLKPIDNEEAKAMTTLLAELQKGRDSGIEKGYYTSEEVRDFINKKGW